MEMECYLPHLGSILVSDMLSSYEVYCCNSVKPCCRPGYCPWYEEKILGAFPVHCKFRKTTTGAASLKHQKARWEIGRIALPCLV